ncbi:single-pass membrane and coiled-coil domain-containing protein 3 [Nothoprocta perdicaria]|uniref:Single-pass membrane protein with coiled-coil domains 3 n=1 Tax=Nothoprocta perdicaria TaxID=30464 RepID=A0A8C6Z703_NOTPE|nr:single-pass membrane and coiled-coil domain-containing protein 3 [Nothoprocta perdicaria]
MMLSDLLYPDNPRKRQELIQLHQELLDCMSTNFHATNELAGVLNEHLGCTIPHIKIRESRTIKENCDIIIQAMSEIQHQVQKIDSDMKEKLEPVLYQKLHDIKEPELEKIAIAHRVFSVVLGEATSTAGMVAIKLIGSNLITLTLGKLVSLLAQIGASVLGGISIAILGLGIEMILHAILGAVERNELLAAVRSYEEHLTQFRAASEKYQRAIREVTSLVRHQAP